MTTTELLQFLRGMLYSSAIAFLVVATLFLIDTGELMRQLSSDASQGHNLLINADSLIVNADSLIGETRTHLKDSSQNLNALLLQAGLAMDNVRRASESQEVYNKRLLSLLDHTDQTIEALDHAISDVDLSIAGVAKESGDSVKALTALEKETASGVQQNSFQLTQTLIAAQQDLSDLGAAISGEETKYIMMQFASSASSLSGASANIDMATSDIARAVHQATKPASMASRVLGWAASGARWFVR